MRLYRLMSAKGGLIPARPPLPVSQWDGAKKKKEKTEVNYVLQYISLFYTILCIAHG